MDINIKHSKKWTNNKRSRLKKIITDNTDNAKPEIIKEWSKNFKNIEKIKDKD